MGHGVPRFECHSGGTLPRVLWACPMPLGAMGMRRAHVLRRTVRPSVRPLLLVHLTVTRRDLPARDRRGVHPLRPGPRFVVHLVLPNASDRPVSPEFRDLFRTIDLGQHALENRQTRTVRRVWSWVALRHLNLMPQGCPLVCTFSRSEEAHMHRLCVCGPRWLEYGGAARDHAQCPGAAVHLLLHHVWRATPWTTTAIFLPGIAQEGWHGWYPRAQCAWGSG